ncbi:hypothetical protein C8J57DRAFT_1052593 [Mycena rebaudengoi]|nr:hypothetical protein C8J57DRAFT_1052593 [Mycena rebaudengoi]
MSEFDNLSDSEWLEVSSNQESDNDSLSSRDSDHDASMPLSRRSSISSSSLDGEIQAWEGFADDPVDDTDTRADPVLPALSAAEHAGPRRMLDSEGRVSEEQFVTAALDQSLVSTLSASRSSSLGVPSTVHSSLRDLRLSFPDPITSSRDELIRSYEALSSAETHSTSDDECDSPIAAVLPGVDPRDEDRQLPDDLDLIVHMGALSASRWFGPKTLNCDVVLYGSTSSRSRDFVQRLFSILAVSGGHISALGSANDRHNARFRLFSETTVTVTFRDGSLNQVGRILTFAFPLISSWSLGRPSLAIVFLPSTIPHLPEHTLYLPVLLPPAHGHFDETEARESWALHDIPSSRILRLTGDSDSPVVVDDAELRSRVDPKLVAHAFEPILASHTRKSPRILDLLEQLRPVHAVTFVALLSLFVGFAVNTGFRTHSVVPTPALVPTETSPAPLWGFFGSPPNYSVSTLPMSSTHTANMGIMPSTLKDMALAVFINPATTTSPVGAPSAAPTPSGVCPSAITGSPIGECKLKTWSERVKCSKDIILRPPTALSSPPTANTPVRTPSVVGTIGTAAARSVEDSSVTSLSLKFVDSLSEVAASAMKALEEVVAHDFKELLGALDDLMRAIGRQTTAILAESKTRAQILRDRLQYRNERAKGKARELKQMGERLVSQAGERLKARAHIAKTRARSLKMSFMTTEVWRTYAEAHGKWSRHLDTKRKRRGSKRAHQVGLFAKLKEKRENRKRKRATN